MGRRRKSAKRGGRAYYSVGKVCLGPNFAHVPTQKSAERGGRAYYLFKAASDGCLSCVRKLIEEEGIDPLTVSTTCKYRAVDFAKWELRDGETSAEHTKIVAYLSEREARARADSALASMGQDRACLGPNIAHVPTQKSARLGGRKYFLFKAAVDGCLGCVRKLIDVEGIDPLAVSTTGKWSALDFVKWHCREGKISTQHAEVIEFLMQFQVEDERQARARGLSTPLKDNKGSSMMRKMGWEPGQSLGKSTTVGLLEPISPVEPARQKAGLGYTMPMLVDDGDSC